MESPTAVVGTDSLVALDLDPEAAARAHRERLVAPYRGVLSEAAVRSIEEQLSGACTVEIAAFDEFSKLVGDPAAHTGQLRVLHTGHTLLLLDAAEAYHREVSRASGLAPEAVRQLLPRLRDPATTRVLIVTLPEATPVHEAKALQDDLVRAGIQPFAWVINQSLLPLQVTDSTLVARRAAEAPYVNEARGLALRLCLAPFDAGLPEGGTTRVASI